MKNPFKNMYLDDVLQHIREKCEELRGRKFKVWRPKAVVYLDEERVTLRIEASRTPSMWSSPLGWSWIALLTASDTTFAPPGHPIHKWKGEPYRSMIKPAGGSGGQATATYVGHLALGYVPLVRQAAQEEAALNRRLDHLPPYPYTDKDRKIMKEREDLEARVNAWRDETKAQMREAAALRSVYTGRLL